MMTIEQNPSLTAVSKETSKYSETILNEYVGLVMLTNFLKVGNRPKRKDNLMAQILLSYTLLAILSWAASVFAYIWVLPNDPAAIGCLIGLSTSIVAIGFLKLRVNIRLCEIYVIATSIFSLTIVAYSLGGTTSVTGYWLLLAIIGGYLLLKRRGGLVTTAVVILCFITMTLVEHYLSISTHYFEFPIDDIRYKSFYTTNLIGFICVFSLFLSIFDKKVSAAYDKVNLINAAVEKKNQHIEAILSSISTGIFSIDEKGIVQTECSRYLLQQFSEEKVIKNHYIDAIFKYSNLSRDQIKMMDTILMSSIGENLMQFFANETNLPQNMVLTLQGQEYLTEITYDPLLHDEIIRGILINIKDVTAQRELQKMSRLRERQSEKVAKLAMLPVLQVKAFLRSAESQIDEISLYTAAPHPTGDRSKMLRALHTLKGNVRAIGLLDIAELAHIAEDSFANSNQAPPDGQASLQALIVAIEEYRDLARDYLGLATRSDDQSFDYLELRAEIAAVDAYYAQDATKMPPPLAKLLGKIKYSSYPPLADYLKSRSEDLSDIAEDLKKPKPHFSVSGAEVSLSSEAMLGLQGALNHILKNSLDHGIEAPEKRAALGKPESGSIVMTVEQNETNLHLVIRDDGSGLNLSRIAAKAMNSGIRVDEADERAVAMLIFRDQLSTKTSVTQTSGRGVGMAAVKEAMENLGGSILIDLDQDSGAQFRSFSLHLIFPQHHWTNLEADFNTVKMSA